MRVGLLIAPFCEARKASRILDIIAGAAKVEGCRLLVAPEAFLSDIDYNKAWQVISKIATKHNIAIACGYSTPEGGELLLWFNPQQKRNQWEYRKHSKANKKELAPNQPDWERSLKRYLFSIPFRGFQICPQICHDLSMPFLPEFVRRHYGIDILLNISGSNVVWEKWATYLQARAIQLNAHVLCCMHHEPFTARNTAGMAAHFTPFGERPLRCLSDGELMYSEDIWQLCKTIGVICDVFVAEVEKPIRRQNNELPTIAQTYAQKEKISHKKFDLTVGVNAGDLQLRRRGDCLIVNHECIPKGKARVIKVKKHCLVVCHLPAGCLPNPLPLWRLLMEHPKDVDGVLAIYKADSERKPSKREICLLAARAMESRVATIFLAGQTIYEVIEVTNYRRAIRIAPCNGIFGIRLKGVGGLKQLYRDDDVYPSLKKVQVLLDAINK